MHGRQLGRELGFPTANMEVADADTIESGVYESYVEIDGVEYKAMSNLGSNPSVGGGPRHLETHIFDFSGDLYGRRLRVELRRKIRDERKFDSLEELQRQIERDRSCILSSENRRRRPCGGLCRFSAGSRVYRFVASIPFGGSRCRNAADESRRFGKRLCIID